MLNKYSIFELFIIFLIFINGCFGRVIYLMAHAEKPGAGILEKDDENKRRISSMEGLGYADDGLGLTGMIRTSYMIDNFGTKAPYYRRPKRIISQHFVFQNNGNFINNGIRGHHTSRRMYHQIYNLSLNLGIDPDAETCCGGSFDDQLKYIYSLPPEDDPILVVNQHGVCDYFARAFAASYGKNTGLPGFGKEPDKVWTMIDGELVDEWYMCAPAIPNSRCTPADPPPAWVSTYQFPSTSQKPPIQPVVKYPSYIYTPGNVHGEINWNYRFELRRRGLWSGEECFNEDLVKPYTNCTNEDDRVMNNHTEEKDELKNEKGK